MRNGRFSGRTIAIWAVIALLLLGDFLVHYPMPRVSIKAEPLFQIGRFTITNTLLSTWIAMAACALFFWAAMRSARAIPGRWQNAAELIVESILGLCTSVAGEKRGRQFFPLIATIFLFALFGSWMGLLPGYGTIGLVKQTAEGTDFVPILRGATTDLNTTLALAVISVIAAQVYSLRAIGAGSYLGKFINVREGPIGLFVGVLELISVLARLISYSFRLFGNIFAGEILLTVIAFLVPFGVALPFLGLEVFVGAIQAFVFAILTLMFLTIGTEAHGSHASEQPATGH